MACVFRSNYAFHLIAKCLTVCPFPDVFARLTVLFEVTYPIFEIMTTLRTRLPDAFHHLVPNDNFHCQTPFKTPNLTYLAVKMRTEIGYL